jgi:hypothetical protein
MDRNLGALGATANNQARHTMHYQWGRKDPFPLDDDLITIAAGPVDKATAIRNPSTFYTSGSDWLDPVDEDMWNASDKKSINDPCPAGYKVITWEGDNDPWEGVRWDYGDGAYVHGSYVWPFAYLRVGETGRKSNDQDQYNPLSWKSLHQGVLQSQVNNGGQFLWWDIISAGRFASSGIPVRCIME